MSPGTQLPGAHPPLEWTFNPWRQGLGNATAGLLTALLGMVLVARLGLPPLAVAALALALAAALHPTFFPAHCRVDETGVGRRLAFGWERRPWTRIGCAVLDRRGLFVTPGFRAGLLASMRGLWLPVPTGAAPAFLDELRRRLAAHGL